MTKVAILGFGFQGQSAYKYYQRLGYHITICDQRPVLDNPPEAALQLGENYLQDLSRFDLLNRTSSLSPDKIVAANNGDQTILNKVTTTSNEFFKQTKTPIIAVTGTKGKGTTCLLLRALLEAANLKVCLTGNIGFDALGFVEEARQADVVVFEIASYQTLDLRYSPQVGVALNVAPDHINWHGDFTSYVRAKAQLFAHQKATDKAVYFMSNTYSRQLVEQSPALKIGYAVDNNLQAQVRIKNDCIYIDEELLMPVEQVALVGRYNLENVCAALAACQDFLPAASAAKIMVKVLRQFKNPENRLEFIREFKGVRYINDSLSTNPHAVQAALASIKEPKILIIGGKDKGIPEEDFLKSLLKANIKHLIAIGPTGVTVAKFLRANSAPFSIERACQTMAEIVQNAASQASIGDVVLLSPGYASHAYFGNATVRANQFKEAVANLQ